jgi:hypothetical protein
VHETDTNETGPDGHGTSPAGPGEVPPGTGGPDVVRDRDAAVRQRLRRPRRRVLVAAGAAVAAAGVTAALLAASAGHAPSPLAAVAGALAKTSAGSYSFSLDSVVRFRGREMYSDVVSGAFDPRHGLGTELLAVQRPQGPVTAQIRFLGRYVYTREPGSSVLGKPWDKAPVPPVAADGIPPRYEIYGFVTDRPVSPAELSAALRSAGTVREAGSASGPGWTGTRYVFTVRSPQPPQSLTATVDLDQQGRVRRLVTLTTQGRQGNVTTDRDLTFGDFGAPVPATAPPASQVAYTSRPYWGFLF